MNIPINEELRAISRQIVEQGKDEEQWSAVESDDEFQAGAFAGGFDADERSFCFSYYATDGQEYWFQFSLEQAFAIAEGVAVVLMGRRAEV